MIKLVSDGGTDWVVEIFDDYIETITVTITDWKNVAKGADGVYKSGYLRLYGDNLTQQNIFTNLEAVSPLIDEDLIVSGTHEENGTEDYVSSWIRKVDSVTYQLGTFYIGGSGRSTRTIKNDGSGSVSPTNNVAWMIKLDGTRWRA